MDGEEKRSPMVWENHFAIFKDHMHDTGLLTNWRYWIDCESFVWPHPLGCTRQTKTKTKEKSVSGSLMNMFSGKRLKHQQVSFHMCWLSGTKQISSTSSLSTRGLQSDLMCFYICTAVLSWGQLRDRQSHRVIIIITEKHNSEQTMFVCAATEKASIDHKMYFLYRCMRECMHPQTWRRKQRPPNKWWSWAMMKTERTTKHLLLAGLAGEHIGSNISTRDYWAHSTHHVPFNLCLKRNSLPLCEKGSTEKQ